MGYAQARKSLEDLGLPRVLAHLILEYSHPAYVWFHKWNLKGKPSSDDSLDIGDYLLDFARWDDFKAVTSLTKPFASLIDHEMVKLLAEVGSYRSFYAVLTRGRRWWREKDPIKAKSLDKHYGDYIKAAIRGGQNQAYIEALVKNLPSNMPRHFQYHKLVGAALTRGDPVIINLIFYVLPEELRKKGHQINKSHLDSALLYTTTHGASPLVQRIMDLGGDNPVSGIIGAIRARDLSLIELFLPQVSEFHDSVISEAIQRYPEIVPRLLKVLRVEDPHLMILSAAHGGSLEWLIYFLPYYQGSLDAAFEWAARHKQSAIVKFLLENHRDRMPRLISFEITDKEISYRLKG